MDILSNMGTTRLWVSCWARYCRRVSLNAVNSDSLHLAGIKTVDYVFGIIGWARVFPRLDLLLVIQMQTRKEIRKSYLQSLRTVLRIGEPWNLVCLTADMAEYSHGTSL